MRTSVARSLTRLRTPYLDVVYAHDVEFVSAEEVLECVTELRRLRDEEGTVRYVGISGYPVDVLCDLAELVLTRTGEPLDAVMSYANYTVQNTRLLTRALPRLRGDAARVDVVPNASVLGMGLLRRTGIPIGGQGDWHPSPDGLRAAVQRASDYCDEHADLIESVAIRWALESWLTAGASVGSSSGLDSAGVGDEREKLGVSVMGVSSLQELEETMRVWHAVLEAMRQSGNGSTTKAEDAREQSLKRRAEVTERASMIREILGEWADYAWDSPGEDFVKSRKKILQASTEQKSTVASEES